jgi:hypothetical protein
MKICTGLQLFSTDFLVQFSTSKRSELQQKTLIPHSMTAIYSQFAAVMCIITMVSAHVLLLLLWLLLLLLIVVISSSYTTGTFVLVQVAHIIRSVPPAPQAPIP